MRSFLAKAQQEEGHASAALGGLIAGAGIVLLGIGAANDTGWLAVVGGILGGVGLLAGAVYQHMDIDYKIYDRLGELEKK